MTSSLEELPDDVISKIASYLPQQGKVNLAYCSYKLYTLALPQLYKRISFGKASVLASTASFQDSVFTHVGYSANQLVSEEQQLDIFDMRQQVLLQSLQINIELCNYIEEIAILSQHDNSRELDATKRSDYECLYNELFDYIQDNCINLRFFRSKSPTIKLQSSSFKKLPNLQNHCMFDLNDIKCLPASVKELEIGILSETPNIAEFGPTNISTLLQLDSLILSDDERSSVIFLDMLLKSLTCGKVLNIKTLKIVHYHGFNDYNHISRELVKRLLDNLNIEVLKNLEIVAGCDQMACACLGEFTKYMTTTYMFKLRKLSIIQKTVHRDHNYTEKFDVAITELLSNMSNNESLAYLFIRHSPPLDCQMGNGFEGNYIKRRDLYAAVLPKLTGLQTLVSPTIMQSLACYEQLVSDLLWNGCECQHCTDYLPLFDHYLMKHNYYDSRSGLTKDAISPVLFGCASDMTSMRLSCYDGLQTLELPLMDRNWNFHGYFGIGHEDDFDCQFNQSCYRPLVTCMSHFLKDYVEELGKSMPHLSLVCFSGVFFVREDQGEWRCLYD
ncbi:hypothetical protein CANARDRAFT_6788 [[Candida] arabinofermentans NRRL YB-2248]|uniref:F-box domain-containing protein n=1 Tax=[Candida] arabinofermentans NRRL YB-2248 TaxID=983967 RepID=A0A1E4T3G7_9ASCO|nr:hypothetical protein CANARDRAFT_6788 [[Candida] arabinofermentans NRRL YB-2248]